MKGTPGYAVAVNMNSVNNATIDFTTIKGVDASGDVSLEANYQEDPADKWVFLQTGFSVIFLSFNMN